MVKFDPSQRLPFKMTGIIPFNMTGIKTLGDRRGTSTKTEPNFVNWAGTLGRDFMKFNLFPLTLRVRPNTRICEGETGY